MSRQYCFFILFTFTFCQTIFSQGLPRQMQLSGDGRMITVGERSNANFYNQNQIPVIYLNFNDTANFWNDLISYHDSLWEYPAQLVYKGITYDSVGIRFKGNSSYDNIGTSLKKSFNISLDAFIDGQDINGYNTLNLNNCYDDPSFMREVFYENQIKRHIPAAQTNFAHLYINGTDWGLYANVQQLNKDFQKEWFLSDEGANFRSSRPPGSTGSGSVIKASFLNLGQDTLEYQKYYTLKSTDVDNSWKKLVDFCTALDTVAPSRKVSVLSQYLDIDRALWFLASEIAFNDFDSYIEKGKNDFYVLYEKETGRFAPLEFDGNDVMDTHYVNSVSALRHQTDTLFPLMSKIIGVPEIRQRYLAHMRTLVADEQDTSIAFPLIDSYYALIDSVVQADPIKLYSYSAFQNSPGILKYYLRNRRLKMLGNSEVNAIGPVISAVEMRSGNVAWNQPISGQSVEVITKVTSTNGISGVRLFSAPGIVGNFTATPMFDDGLHNDSLAGDGYYGATIAGQPGGTWMRFYVEAASNNSAKTVSYDPPGAEHDVYTYIVKPALAADSTSIVINELMARNTSTVADPAGQFEDWIELYNTSNDTIDVSGYYLSDNENNILKWQIPAGTKMAGHEYLTIWADEDKSQAGLHCNFKFSASGEQLTLLNAAGELINKVIFGPQQANKGLARLPNGTGPFFENDPSFGYNNNPQPIVNLSATTLSGCGSFTTNFFSGSSNVDSLFWDFGDGSALSSVPSPTHIYSTPGVYHVVLIAYGGGWIVTDTLDDQINVYAQPNFSFATDTIYAATQSYVLAADSGYNAYTWNTGDLTDSINVTSSGSYCVTVETAQGCSNTACVYVKITPLAIAQFTTDSNPACAPAQISFQNQSTLAVSYRWYFGDGSATSTDENPVHSYPIPGTYVVELHAYNALNDSSIASVNVLIHPQVSFNFMVDTIHAPTATYLLDPGTGYASYLWSTGANTQSILVDSTASYYLVVSDQNGCKDTAFIYISVNGLGRNEWTNASGSIISYPNPAHEFVQLRTAENKTAWLEVFTAQGALIHAQRFTRQASITTSDWANGIYLFKLNGVHAGKFVVEHP